MASNAMVPFQPQNLAELDTLADKLAKSSLIPEALRGKPADVAVVLMTGAELGLGPMLALRSIYVVKGRPTLSADLMGALVQRSEACEYLMLVESTSEKATYETRRKGSPKATRLTWTIAQARAAGLTNSQTWKAYPDAMLRARCLSALVRVAYPDLLAGVYDPDELADRAAPSSYVEAVVVEPQPQPAEEVDQTPQAEILEQFTAAINNAQDLDALNAVAARIRDAGVTDEGRAALIGHFKSRKAALTKPAEEQTKESPDGEVAA